MDITFNYPADSEHHKKGCRHSQPLVFASLVLSLFLCLQSHSTHTSECSSARSAFILTSFLTIFISLESSFPSVHGSCVHEQSVGQIRACAYPDYSPPSYPFMVMDSRADSWSDSSSIGNRLPHKKKSSSTIVHNILQHSPFLPGFLTSFPPAP